MPNNNKQPVIQMTRGRHISLTVLKGTIRFLVAGAVVGGGDGDGDVGSGGAESVLVGHPREGHALALGSDPVGGALVGVAAAVGVVAVVAVAVRVAAGALGVGLLAGGAV